MRKELVAQSCDAGPRRPSRRLCLLIFPACSAGQHEDDVVQNAAIRLLRSLEAVTPNSVAGYFTLAAREIRRELIDLSRHHYGPEGPVQDTLALCPRRMSTPLRQRDDHPKAPWTRRWQLGPNSIVGSRSYRPNSEVFDLLCNDQMSQEEAAGSLGVSLATLQRPVGWQPGFAFKSSCSTCPKTIDPLRHELCPSNPASSTFWSYSKVG